MRETVRSWTLETWEEYGGVLEDFFRARFLQQREFFDSVNKLLKIEPPDPNEPPSRIMQFLVDPEEEKARRLAYISRREEAESEQPRREREALIDEVASKWPVCYQGGVVGLVIRQWSQEGPNRTVANALARWPG